LSTVKDPSEKKLLSLKKDRRNVYGENPASSRKHIAKGKQRGHQNERRVVTEALMQQVGPASELDADAAEAEVRDRAIIARRLSFKKSADAPLADVLYRKTTGNFPKFEGGSVHSNTLSAIRKK